MTVGRSPQQARTQPATLCYTHPFPSTRYQGSKRKSAAWIWDSVAHLDFDSALDLFGGTGVIAHTFKRAGKRVIYNDALRCNWQMGRALIENRATTLSAADLERILTHQPTLAYPDFIQRTFRGIYFTDSENAWLDRTITNIDTLLDGYAADIARFALYQACIVKRPYNLFHRANLYMRLAQVRRSFGNKKTWDRPFEAHLRAFAAEANAAIFDNGRDNRALCGDALAVPEGADLVYIDPPYINARGVGVDYHGFYHFLEGLADVARWPERVDYASKHRRLIAQDSPWTDPVRIYAAFDAVFARFRDSILVVSYRADGIPTRGELLDLLRAHKPGVQVADQPQQYALSTRTSRELLLIAP